MIVKQYRWVGFFVLLAVLLCGLYPAVETAGKPNANYRFFAGAGELQAYMKWRPDRVPLISAHRGGPMNHFPENALETFENTLTFAPCLIECDVRITKDAHLVVIHDNTLERTTTGKGKVSDFTLARIERLFLKDVNGKLTAHRVPRFGDVLRWAVGRAVLTIDVKARDGVPFEKVISEIRRHNAEGHSIIIVYNNEDMLKVHRLAPDLTISVSVNGIKGVEKLLVSGVPPDKLVAFIGVYEPEPVVYEMLHEKGIRTILGTMHNLDNKAAARGVSVYRRLYENGADILSTDNVPLLSSARIHLHTEEK